MLLGGASLWIRTFAMGYKYKNFLSKLGILYGSIPANENA